MTEGQGRDEARESPAFCPHGCYCDCEHRIAAGTTSPERAGLREVQHTEARPLLRCAECGDYFHDAAAHGREHQRLRQLGWLPERPSRGWTRGGKRSRWR
jgi:hypothetical protein